MVNYSSWDKGIEISDDEDETHPNVDTASLHQCMHESRLLRKEEMEAEEKGILEARIELKKRKDYLEGLKEEGMDVTAAEEEYVKAEKAVDTHEAAFLKKKQASPWDVDNISTPGYSKTVINSKPIKPEKRELSDEEKGVRYTDFAKGSGELVQQFGMLRKYDDSKRFLLEHPQLVCEDTSNYLLLWCITLAMEKKLDLMKHVSHQCVAMNFLLQLAKQLDCDPKSCMSPFFSRMEDLAQVAYKEGFEAELKLLRKHIRTRAEVRVKEALKEDREKRLGPGGLDPAEVFESLPKELKKCFQLKDIPMLQEAFMKMPEEEASYHLKRCIDSGLWCPAPEPQPPPLPPRPAKTTEKLNLLNVKMALLTFTYFLLLFLPIRVSYLGDWLPFLGLKLNLENFFGGSWMMDTLLDLGIPEYLFISGLTMGSLIIEWEISKQIARYKLQDTYPWRDEILEKLECQWIFQVLSLITLFLNYVITQTWIPGHFLYACVIRLMTMGYVCVGR